jgi:hypothetical protein
MYHSESQATILADESKGVLCGKEGDCLWHFSGNRPRSPCWPTLGERQKVGPQGPLAPRNATRRNVGDDVAKRAFLPGFRSALGTRARRVDPHAASPFVVVSSTWRARGRPRLLLYYYIGSQEMIEWVTYRVGYSRWRL